MLCQRHGWDGIALKRAFDQPVKQLAARAGSSPVKPEGKLIQIAGKVFWADSSLMRSKPPALQEGGHTMSQWRGVACGGILVEVGDMDVTVAGQTAVTAPPVRAVSKGGSDEDLYVTGEHPFWLPDTAEWKNVDDLGVGDTLLDFGGHRLHVSAKLALSEKRETYNITVEGTSTYFVGRSEVLCQQASPAMRRRASLPRTRPEPYGSWQEPRLTGRLFLRISVQAEICSIRLLRQATPERP